MKTLFLLFSIGNDRYAFDVREVVEVLGLTPLKRLPGAPQWVSGLLARHGDMVPVIDVSAMATGEPAPRLASTRIVLVQHRREGESARVLGLRLAGVNGTMRCDPEEFVPAGVDTRAAPWLGPVREDDGGIVQWVDVQRLLPAGAQALLFPATPARGEADDRADDRADDAADDQADGAGGPV